MYPFPKHSSSDNRHHGSKSRLLVGPIITTILCLGIADAGAASFKVAQAFSLDETESKSIELKTGTGEHKANWGISHSNYKPKTLGLENHLKTKTLTLRKSYSDKDGEPISQTETRYQWIDGTNVLVQTEASFSQDLEQPPAHYFNFPLRHATKDLKLEIITSEGTVKSYFPARQELEIKDLEGNFRDVRQVTLQDSGLYLQFKPGKDSELWISDTRLKDVPLEAAEICIRGVSRISHGLPKKGSKSVFETKLLMKRAK